MKGIVLAGGTGSRLWPLTLHISKQLLPIYDKPLIYYPISTLMLAGINDILIITRPDELELFKKLLGDGSNWGINLSYETQEKPRGLAESFIIGEDFLAGDEVCLILGDNIFFGTGLGKHLSGIRNVGGAHIFGYRVKNPEDYGVVCVNDSGEVTQLVEKPSEFVSNIAVPGIYFYSNEVCSIAKRVSPSKRGELEITSINNYFLERDLLTYSELGRGTLWLDTGSFEGMQAAAQFISVVQHRQGITIGSPEEAAINNGWITEEHLRSLTSKYVGSGYLQGI
jgi:glucose-1-phosphate thymidylyltransferase